MSYRSHTTIPTRSSNGHGLILIGLVIMVALLGYAWHVLQGLQANKAAKDSEAEQRDKATAIAVVLQSYQQGHRDAMEAIFSAQGVSLEQVCRAAGRSAAPELLQ